MSQNNEARRGDPARAAVEAIEKAMEGVTAGEWSVEGFDDATGQVNVVGDGFFIAGVIANQPDQVATAAYIAACNPVAMREVLARARQAEALKRENAELRAERRMIVSHATMGGTDGEGMSVNAVSVEITRLRNHLIEDTRARALLGGENAE